MSKKQTLNPMKKIILSVFTLGILSIVACGPSAEEKAAAEKARLDSIANAEAEIAKATEDSLMAVQAAVQKAIDDSLTAARQKALEDSLAVLSGSMKKMQQKAATQKAKEEKKIEDYKKQSKGKG